MVFVIPESSKSKSKKDVPKLEKTSSPTMKNNKSSSMKSGFSNTIATSTPTKTLLKKKKKKKKKRMGRVSFTMNSPDVKIFQPVDQKDKEKLWHSHEDSIRNRIQLRQEKFEEKLAVKQQKEIIEEKKVEEIKTKEEQLKEAKRLKKERKEKKRKERERIRKEKERLILKRKMEQQEKKELRKHQKQAKKAQKKIEHNLLKKFNLHVDEVEDDDDDAIHDKINELELELENLKAKAVEKAREKHQKKMALRTGRTVGKGNNWKKGRKQNVVDFNDPKTIALPSDMIGSLTLKQRHEMKKHTYSFD